MKKRMGAELDVINNGAKERHNCCNCQCFFICNCCLILLEIEDTFYSVKNI